jgi:lysophospholipase
VEPAAPRAEVVLVHGYCDHGGRLEHVADLLGARGFRVAAGDLRGHGRSAGRRGHIERFEQYLDDVGTMLARSPRAGRAGALPVFLVGHSLGGLVALRFAQRHPARVEGVALVAPFLGLAFPVPAWKRAMAWALSAAWPPFSLPNEMPADILCHDPEWVARFEADPLVFRHATARWYTETVAAQREAFSTPLSRVPLLLLLAGDDRVVCNDTARRLHAALGSSREDVREYPGFFHNVFDEPGHGRAVDDVVAWIEDRLAASRAPGP